MDAELRDKISDLVEYIESLNDNHYYAKRRAKTLEEIGGLIQQEIAKARLETLHDFYNENYEAIDSNAGLLNSVAADIAELSQTLKESKEE